MTRFTLPRGIGCLRRPIRSPTVPLRMVGRRFQSDVPSEKPYYVTSPIFYVNANPHIGHMYSVVLADVLKRWQTLQGRKALLCTGTDEHGLKVQQAAAKAGVAPKQFCDQNAAVFEELTRKADIANDFFIRTTDADHAAAVRAVWRRLRRKGFVYRAEHAGWYCVSDETFYPESMLERRMNDETGKVEVVSIETGKTVEWTKETNYHFRMTAVRDRLLQFYETHPDFVVPETRMAEVVDWVTHHLEDLSISRPASRLSWGIPVPEDAAQTVYVWVDALINYLTKAGYPERWAPEEAALEAAEESDAELLADRETVEEQMLNPEREVAAAAAAAEAEAEAEGQKEASSSFPLDSLNSAEQKTLQEGGGWPADVHVLGKDIVRFHAVYWPALLLALDLPLPRRILSHAHWTLGRRKMSKSVGNVVNPFFAMDRFGVDAMRYYLVHDGGIEDDADYGNEHIVDRYKKGLQDGLGNLVGRLTRSPRWSVREAVESAPDWARFEDALLQAQVANVAHVAHTANSHFLKLDPRAALHAIMRVVYATNKFVSDTQPWVLAKSQDPAQRQRLNEVIYLAAEAVRIVGILLQPYVPTKAAEMLDVLGVASTRRTFADAQLGADSEYGTPLKELTKGKHASLFPPLPVED